ncbi:MAG: hypothetical protein NT033_07375, partial [Candidatus Omnitrophica bacterium]|nr:hypothetical protein [Candidatus Omnitrophota bacterium]
MNWHIILLAVIFLFAWAGTFNAYRLMSLPRFAFTMAVIPFWTSLWAWLILGSPVTSGQILSNITLILAGIVASHKDGAGMNIFKRVSGFLERHKVLLAFVAAIASPMAFHFLNVIKLSVSALQMTFWVFCINAFLSFLVVVPLFAIYKKMKTASAYSKLMRMFAALSGKEWRLILTPGTINLIVSLGVYFVFPKVSIAILLVLYQLGNMVTWILAFHYNREKEGWPRKMLGGAIGLLFGVVPMVLLTLNTSVFQLKDLFIGVAFGLLAGTMPPALRKVFQYSKEARPDHYEELAQWLPIMLLLSNYVVNFLLLVPIMLISGEPFLIHNGISILSAHNVFFAVTGVSFFIVFWLCNFKLQRMLSFDVSQFSAIFASGPMISIILEKILGLDLSGLIQWQTLAALMVICGAYISGTGDSECTLRDLLKEGYVFKEERNDVTDGILVRSVTVYITKDGKPVEHVNVKLAVIPEIKTIVIPYYDPHFPIERKGRGRALLR